jgi:hypothetical protein
MKNKRKNFIPLIRRHIFWVEILLCTIAWALFILYRMDSTASAGNFLVQYYNSIVSVQAYIVSLLSAVFIINVVGPISRLLKVKKNRFKNIVKKTTIIFFRVVLAGIAIIHLSLLLAFLGVFVAIIQANILIKNNPAKVGVVDGREAVTEALKNRNTAPQISTSLENLPEILISDYLGRHYHFANYSAKSISNALLKKIKLNPVLPDSNVLILGDTLVIRELLAEELTVVGPELSRLLVVNYFYPRNIKSSPELTVLSRQEYLKFRDDEINNKIAEIDKSITTLSSRIAVARSQMTNIIMRYYYGQLEIGDAISQYQGQESLISRLQGEQSQLKKQKEFVKLQKDTTPYELGIFMPDEPNRVRVVLDSTQEDALNPFLVTLVHEHLHYASYIDKERVLPTFFEEGLTEYFARKIVGDQLGIQAEVGYPVIVRIIQGFVKKVPEEKLADAYFNKDINMLKNALNEAYGENFYEESEFHFTMIPFSDRDNSIKLGNDILSVIGESDINEADIFE